MTSRCQGLFPPHPFFEGKALGTRLNRIINNLRSTISKYKLNRNRCPGGGGGTPHVKGVGMLVVSFRDVNFGFWSHLGCSGQNAIIFSRKGLV